MEREQRTETQDSADRIDGGPECYFAFSRYLAGIFGEKVYKIPLSLGTACPNKDGTISQEGCIFCDAFGSGPVHTGHLELKEQMELGMERIRRKHGAAKCIAYFQANTSTAAPLDMLRRAVEIVLRMPGVVGIAIGTRPDCLPPPCLEYLAELNRRTHLWIELGLQSIHARSLAFLRRHHTLADFVSAFAELKKRGIWICTHVILGIPGEGENEVRETAQFLSTIRADGVKIHPLHVLKDTALEELFRKKEFKPLSLAQYVRLAVVFLENLSAGIVIQRMTGEREKELFVAPAWALDKNLVLRRVEEALKKAGSRQGARCAARD